MLAGKIYKLTNSGEFKKDFGLKDQIRRAAVSVMANIARVPWTSGNSPGRSDQGFHRGGRSLRATPKARAGAEDRRHGRGRLRGNVHGNACESGNPERLMCTDR